MYEIFWLSLGLSPTQIIAVLSFLSLRCLSKQFADAFKVPSWNQLIFTSFLLYLTSLIFLYGLIHVILFPSFFQNSSLFFIDLEYLSWYCFLLARLFFTHSALGFKTISLVDRFFLFFLETFFLTLVFLNTFFLIFHFLSIFFLIFFFFFFLFFF